MSDSALRISGPFSTSVVPGTKDLPVKSATRTYPLIDPDCGLFCAPAAAA